MVHIIHHVDLDGYGVKLLGQLYAEQTNQPFECFKSGYSKVNWVVSESLASFPDEIIIGDLSINQETAERLNKCYNDGLQLRLRDHHAGAEWLNKYPWALVKSDDEVGISRCGTYWLAQDKEFDSIRPYIQYLINLIDDYDTWKWVEKNNLQARNLNAIFNVMGNDFYDWLYRLATHSIKSRIPIREEDVFIPTIQAMVDARNHMIQNQVHSCEYYMSVMNLWMPVEQPDGTSVDTKFNTGIIYILDNLSEVAEILLTNHPELDILMMIVPPACISWRTKKDLPISLGQIANWATGNGGGHSQAASSILSIPKSQELLALALDKAFEGNLSYSGLRRHRD